MSESAAVAGRKPGIKVCHLSSAHRGLDMRIFQKECVSLAQAGYDTHLVIAASPAEVRKAAAQGVSLHAMSPAGGRLGRMIGQAWRCYRIARKLDADIYHFHDPELIPYGVLLKLAGKRVIYDVHEDLPRDILDKEWIPPWMRKLVAGASECIEDMGARWFFDIVAATPFIVRRFQRVRANSVNVNNYPKPAELVPPAGSSARKKQVCYAGGIERIRGLKVIVAALPLMSDVRLALCGRFSDPAFEEELRAMPGWRQVDYLGYIDRPELQRVMSESVAGLVTLFPIPGYVDSNPTKMFEYMSAELPVIASDFPLWRRILEETGAGICVDPHSPQAIAGAVLGIMDNPEEAVRMGKAGRAAILGKYNWPNEARALLELYARGR